LSIMSTCATCSDPLTLEIEVDDDDADVSMGGASSSTATAPKTVPDDVELLACGCHFHWYAMPWTIELASVV